MAKPKTKKARKPRTANKLFAKMTLKKLAALLDDDPTAIVTVSRNFALDTQREKEEGKAAKKLFVD